MGKRKNKIIIATVIFLLLCAGVVCFVFRDKLFYKVPVSSEKSKELVTCANGAVEEATRIIVDKEADYDTAVEYLENGDFDKAYIFFDGLKEYKNSKDYAAQIKLYDEAIFKESKKNHIGAADLMAQCELIPGAAELASDYKTMTEIISLAQKGEYEDAKPLFDTLTTLSDEEKHDLELSGLSDYLFWLIEEEEAETAASVLPEVMSNPEWVEANWGLGYDYDNGESVYFGYGYGSSYARRYISYSELGPGKNIGVLKMYADKDDNPDYYYITVYQYKDNGYYFREFAFSMDGRVLYKPFAKRSVHYAGPTDGNVEKIDNPEYEANVEKAHELIGKGRASEAGKLLSPVASDKEYLDSYYQWYGTDENSFMGGAPCDTCIRYYNDTAIIFGVYYKGDFETPIAFFYRYFDGNKIFFATYDMNGKYLDGWGN